MFDLMGFHLTIIWLFHFFYQPSGDEIDVLNDSWLFLIWTSDHCPYRSNSACSRWPIAVFPKSLYYMDPNSGVNVTIQAATAEITKSFNKLSEGGIKIRNFQSMGHEVAVWNKQHVFVLFFWCFFELNDFDAEPSGRVLSKSGSAHKVLRHGVPW